MKSGEATALLLALEDLLTAEKWQKAAVLAVAIIEKMSEHIVHLESQAVNNSVN